MRAFFVEIARVLRGIVNELSDHNAYQRHLAAHRACHSPEEWRRFQDELWKAKARRARCC
jgi:hypothetical protein